MGTWELTKGETLPPGSTCEFTKDGKIKLVLPTPDGKKLTLDGTYKIMGQAFRATFKQGDKESSETLKVPTLTDKELVMVDEKDKKDAFKKK